jgi:hypothetical protein
MLLAADLDLSFEYQYNIPVLIAKKLFFFFIFIVSLNIFKPSFRPYPIPEATSPTISSLLDSPSLPTLIDDLYKWPVSLSSGSVFKLGSSFFSSSSSS